MTIGTTTKRIALASLLWAAAVTSPGAPAQAGPLCDWLFGRHAPPPPPPYAAQYPVYAAQYPVYAAQYSAAQAVAPVSGGYSAGYPGTLPPVSYQAPVGGAAALQMPAYQSYYGAPAVAPAAVPAYAPAAVPAYAAPAAVDRGYGVYTPPLRGTYPPSGVPQTSYYGTGNYYPDFDGAPANVAPVTAYQPAMNPAAIPAAPPAGSTIQTYPGIPAARPGVLGGLSRFFGSLFGTGYSTSSYRAPVTYYRPVTQLDASGQPVVVQMPCTSYQQQLQRTPFTTFAPAQGAGTIAPPSACATVPGGSVYNPYNNSLPAGVGDPYASSGVAPAAGVMPGNYYGPPVGQSAPATQPGSMNQPGSGLSPYTNPDSIPLAPPSLDGGSSYAPSPSAGSPTTQAMPPVRIIPQTTLSPSGLRVEAPPLQNSDSASSSANPYVRPLPAGDYPYPRQQQGSQQSDSARPQQPDYQSAEELADRVASSQLGYKPIEWKVQRASYQRPASEQPVSDPPPVRLRAPATAQPSNVTQQPTRQPLTVRAQQTPPAGPIPAGRPIPAAKSAPESRDDYQSLGWSSRPRR
ncbi:hypothetical protein SH139x_004139 [Planctomycetaceae bacterium SH139]